MKNDCLKFSIIRPRIVADESSSVRSHVALGSKCQQACHR